MMERDYVVEIREAKAKVTNMASQRDRLIRDEATEAQKVREAQAKLTELGVEDVASLTTKQLQELADTKKTELDHALKAIQEQLALGEKVLAEYDALTGV